MVLEVVYMGFRQKNDSTSRKWDQFCQANIELIRRIGLPVSTVDTWDRFADLLMHDYIDHHDDPFGFTIDELTPEQRALFIVLIDKYFAAGFSDPGMGHWLVGGYEEFYKLVRKYPAGFSPYDIERANEQE